MWILSKSQMKNLRLRDTTFSMLWSVRKLTICILAYYLYIEFTLESPARFFTSKKKIINFPFLMAQVMVFPN